MTLAIQTPIEATLAAHPAVRRAKVVAGGDPRAPSLIAYIEAAGAVSGSRAEEATHLARWCSLWSDTYRRSSPAGAPELNLAGWISSYTGKPIAAREMEEWVERTVERITDLEPRHLLEIGCGTGLLMLRIAPRCASYWASDFSPEALDHVRGALAGKDLPVTLLRRTADELDGLPAGRFDTVVLNSVVQYFPDLAYLRRVLAGIVRIAAPGARIFLGDLRSLPLLGVFHASVLLQQADDSTTCAELRAQLASKVSRETELALDPAFFAALQREEPAIAEVEVQLKRGRARNELTCFRYDVILRLAGGPAAAAAPERWLDWRQDGLTLAAVRRLLAAETRSLGLAGVPSSRLATQVRALELLSRGGPGLETVADLQEAMRRDRGTGIEPEELWALERDLPFRVEVRWGRAGLETFDVVLRNREVGSDPPAAAAAGGAAADPAVYANDPLRQRLAGELEVELRRFLAERLPGAPLPSSFVLVDRIEEAPGAP
jgi:SAM-dependent methyltransferase